METLGMIIRWNRECRMLGLREVARRVGISPSYLSDIELDRRQPADLVLREIAREIGMDAEELSCRSGRLGPEAVDYLRRHPRMVILINRIASRGLTEDVMQEMERLVEACKRRQ